MIRLSLIAVALCSLTLPLDAQRRGSPGSQGGTKPKNCSFERDTFASESLKRNLPYGIYLPLSYDKDKKKRYPVVIWLHGMFEDHMRFHTRGGAEVLDKMLGDGELPECIFVCANGDRSSFYVNGKTSGRWEDAIGKDLLDHIDETYRISPDRGQRAIMGVSMGGYGALKIALKHPERFGIVAAHSAALLPEDSGTLEERFPWLQRFGGARRVLGQMFGNPIDQKMWAAENVFTIVDKLDVKSLDGLRIYFDCGDQDRYGFHEPNQRLHTVLTEKKIKHGWQLVEGGNHGWRTRGSKGIAYNAAQLPSSLRFVAAAWTQKRAAAGLGGLLRGGKDDKDGKTDKR